MASASRSTALFLYSSVDKLDDLYKFSVDVDNDDVEFKAAAQDLKFEGAAYKFKAGAAYFDLESRFGTLEGSTVGADNAAAITLLQGADATESNARIAGDLARENATAAEIAARVLADAAIQADVDQNEADADSAIAAANAAIAAEATARAAAVAAEAATRAAAITAVQLSISSILSNATAGSIDSLSEVVAAYTAGDTTLATQAAALLTRLAACESLLNDLTGSSLG